MHINITLSIEETLLRRVFRIAEEREQTTEQVLLSALPLGLDTLMAGKQAVSSATPSLGVPARFAWPSVLDEQGKSFIREHAASMRNQELAHTLRLSFQEAREARLAYAEEFVLTNWKTKNDAELRQATGRLSMSIIKFRNTLGLRRQKYRNGRAPAEVDAEELKRAVTVGGKTLTEFFRSKGVACTRERMRQIANEKGVETSATVRTVEWYTTRWNIPHLAEKAVFERESAEAKSTQALAGKYGDQELTVNKVRVLARKHGISLPDGRCTTELVPLVCANPHCGRSFSRSHSLVETNSMRTGKKQNRFFCSRACFYGAVERKAKK